MAARSATKAKAPKAKATKGARTAPANTDEKAKDTAVLRGLASKVKEINVRLEKAAKMESDAFDHRLAAAIELGNAKETLDKAGINFKSWYAKNITAKDKKGTKLSYETVRKLAAIGQQKDPAAALEGTRAKNATANKALRERKATEHKAISAPTKKPGERAMEAMDALTDGERMNLVKSAANSLGMKVIPEGSRDTTKSEAKPGEGLDGMKAAFSALKPSDKMEFVKWAAAEVGMKVNNPFESTSGDTSDNPPALRRERRARKTAA